jgi:hypothetical protein
MGSQGITQPSADAHRCSRGKVAARRPRGTVQTMQPVPIDEGARGRRRIGPFWIEEGLGLVVAGAAFLAAVIALYVLAVVLRPA